MVAESIKDSAQTQEIPAASLRNDLIVTEDAYSSEEDPSWVIYDPVNGKYFRAKGLTLEIIPMLSRGTTVKELAERAAALGLNISEKEILGTIGFLSSNSLLSSSYYQTENLLAKKTALKKKTASQRIISSLLFLRIPVWSPDNFLSATQNIVRMIFNKWTLISLFALSITGYICVIPQWTRLAMQFRSSLSYQGLIHYALTIILLKIFHEFAHAYTAKSLCIPVRKFGIFLIIFFPRLYTDLTDSWKLIDRKKRMLIDSAGIIFELAAGGLAGLLWLNTGAGALNSIAFHLMAVSALSALLVNGNPLIKFDGYYLLMDCLNVDNLQRQSASVFREFIYKYAFGIAVNNFETKSIAPWRKAIMAVYAVSSFIYRFFLYAGIILIIYFMFTKTLAILLAGAEVYSLFYLPVKNELKTLTAFKKNIAPNRVFVSSAALALLLLALTVPLPWNIESPCEVSSLEIASVFIQQEGFLKSFDAANGQEINKTDLLVTMENPFIEMEIEQNKIELELLTALKRIASTRKEELALVKIREEQIKGIKKRLSEDSRRKALLEIRAPFSGTFILYDDTIKPGRWLRRGELIGEVANPQNAAIFAYIEETDLAELKAGDRAYVILSGELNGFYGRVASVDLVPHAQWKNSPLLNVSGGKVEAARQNYDGTFSTIKNFYRVTIRPDERISLLQGRAGTAKIRKYSSIAGNFFRFVLSVFHREFSF